MCQKITTTIVQIIEIFNNFFTYVDIKKYKKYTLAKRIPFKCYKQVCLVPLNSKKINHLNKR